MMDYIDISELFRYIFNTICIILYFIYYIIYYVHIFSILVLYTLFLDYFDILINNNMLLY